MWSCRVNMISASGRFEKRLCGVERGEKLLSNEILTNIAVTNMKIYQFFFVRSASEWGFILRSCLTVMGINTAKDAQHPRI